MSHRRVKSRDVYDLWFLSEYGYVNVEEAWEDYQRQHSGIHLRTMLDDIVNTQLGYYLEDWREGAKKGIYPTGPHTPEQFEDMLLVVLERLGGR